MIKNFLPKSLLGRALLIIVMPLIILQLVSATIFYETHWAKVSRKLAYGLVGDIATLVELLRLDNTDRSLKSIQALASQNMGLSVRLKKNQILSKVAEAEQNWNIEDSFVKVLRSSLQRPFNIKESTIEKHILVNIQLSEGVLQVEFARKRLFSSTTYVFVLWMVGTSMILFGLATIFMRNQVKPIRRLAIAAEDFGKGRDTPNFKPEGAIEVRQASSAFISMRDRIKRQVSRRTEMLAGVSHDLRTPITRMKLQLELLKENKNTGELARDLSEMEHMLEGYLAFARGEGEELPKEVDVVKLVKQVIEDVKKNGANIGLSSEKRVLISLRPNLFRRCIANLIENADRYASAVSVELTVEVGFVKILIDDNGPGISEELRDQVFRPFFRLDDSRNLDTGGVGLGLAIARDAIISHGGEIELQDSPTGGLRVMLKLPF
tara:strand:- start:652 stop:1959 length:1308 start_codon:yes stop_codon:yes gene_type:complete